MFAELAADILPLLLCDIFCQFAGWLIIVWVLKMNLKEILEHHEIYYDTIMSKVQICIIIVVHIEKESKYKQKM